MFVSRKKYKALLKENERITTNLNNYKKYSHWQSQKIQDIERGINIGKGIDWYANNYPWKAK